ncbi:MAG: hypothetical protein AAF716_05585 [Cyanobacteria bacterium P01_D01_bin.1]
MNRKLYLAVGGLIAFILFGSVIEKAVALSLLEGSVSPKDQSQLKQTDRKQINRKQTDRDELEDFIEDLEATEESIDESQEIFENIETIEENIEIIEESIEEAIEEEIPVYEPIRQAIQCPTEIEPLAELLIRDIPGYTNRVLQRAVAVLPWTDADVLRSLESDEIVRQPYRPSRVLFAGKLNLEPLDLNEYAFSSSPQTGADVTQIFFTTLSRQYDGPQVSESQEYHWVFLTQTADGWRLAFMFSAVDSLPIIQVQTPPRESSEGSVGQAIQLWLRDCRAGAIAAS